jgi:hypothetical protein
MRILIPVLMILRISYAPIDGTDVEYGQGAVERLQLAHAPLTDRTWLIRVDDPDLAAWQRRLDEAVDPRHGSFTVETPAPEDLARVEGGEIRFQQ